MICSPSGSQPGGLAIDAEPTGIGSGQQNFPGRRPVRWLIRLPVRQTVPAALHFASVRIR